MGWKSCLASYVWFIPADKSSRETERGPGGNKWRARRREGRGSKRASVDSKVRRERSVRREDVSWWYDVLSAKQQQKGHRRLVHPLGMRRPVFLQPLLTTYHTHTHTHFLLHLYYSYIHTQHSRTFQVKCSCKDFETLMHQRPVPRSQISIPWVCSHERRDVCRVWPITNMDESAY